MVRTWLELRNVWFLNPKNPDFDPNMGARFFGTVAFVHLDVGPVLAPSDISCHFSFPCYAPFREGTRPTRQKFNNDHDYEKIACNDLF